MTLLSTIRDRWERNFIILFQGNRCLRDLLLDLLFVLLKEGSDFWDQLKDLVRIEEFVDERAVQIGVV